MKLKMYNFKSVKLVASFILLIGILNSTAGEIPFQKGTLKDALQLAAAKNKLVFVDAYTTWCGPCKWMAKNVFTDEKVVRFYEANFICLKLDMEKGEGLEFSKKYDIHAYPTFVFLDQKGIKIHQVCGSKEAIEFINDGQNALNPKSQLFSHQNRFKNGERGFDFLRSYASILMNANIDNQAVIDEIINLDGLTDLLSKTDFDLISNNCDLNSNAFNFIIANKDKFLTIVEKQKIDDLITDVFLNESTKAAKEKNIDLLAQAEKKTEKIAEERSEELITRMRYHYALITKTGIYETALPYVEKIIKRDASELNNVAWALFENYKEEEPLKFAAKCASMSVKVKEDYANTDTYAHILFKLGEYNEALNYAKLSVMVGKKSGEDTSETENLKAQIEAALKAK